MAWESAAQFCKARGGALARLTSKSESKAVARAAREVRKEDWWIGLHDRTTEGKHSWIDEKPGAFLYWASGEPDDYACAENCGAIKDSSSGRWRDLYCAAPRPFVCRIAATE
jgi:hypothetical protein